MPSDSGDVYVVKVLINRKAKLVVSTYALLPPASGSMSAVRNVKIDGANHDKYRRRDRDQPAPDSPSLAKRLGVNATKGRGKKRCISGEGKSRENP